MTAARARRGGRTRGWTRLPGAPSGHDSVSGGALLRAAADGWPTERRATLCVFSYCWWQSARVDPGDGEPRVAALDAAVRAPAGDGCAEPRT